jgi:hypothetical protein
MTVAQTASDDSLRRRLARVRLYVGQMFPLPVMAASATFHFLAVWFALQALAGIAPVQITPAAVRGAASVFLILLLMRLYDELKDAASDIVLGRAGDPLYRDRVLVTGAVHITDVHWLRWVVTASLIVVNMPFTATWRSATFWILFGVMWLSFKWFFWPGMSRHLLLAFVTHNPISLLVVGYVVALFADEFGTGRLTTSTLLLMLGLWLPVATWETSRKIRAPGEETAYSTYSKVLGWRVAAIVPAAFALGSAGALTAIAIDIGLSPLFYVLIGTACALLVWRCLLFRLAPSRARAQLKPFAMIYVLAANAGLAASIAIDRGMTW